MGQMMASKYGFDKNNKVVIDAVIAFIQRVNDDSFTKKQWGGCKIHYDVERDFFVAIAGFSFLSIKHTVPDKDVFEAVENLRKAMEIEIKKTDLQDKYCEAVNYFHHDVYIDDEGLFIKTGIFSKKYFSLAELDEMNEKFKKKNHSKRR